MPNLRSLDSFAIGQNDFKVYGDGLSNCDVHDMTTHVSGIKWQQWSTPGKSPNHVNVHATLAASTKERVKDTVGDLTITVKDTQTGQTATGTFTVLYTP
jgi:hypothetical protein